MENQLRNSFYSGLSGLQLPVPKYRFPPEFENKSRLTIYSTLYNSIEVNSTFYKLPKPVTISNWSASVSDNFKFTFKLFKEITHCEQFSFHEENILKFFDAINAIGNKKGCLLIQLPPSIGNEYISNLDKLLVNIRQIDNVWKIAVEFRNKSWYNERVYNLLNYFGAALVIHDMPKSATPSINHSSEFIYVRFHGPTGNYRDSYTDDFLSEYSSYINNWRNEGKEVYVYFNNTAGDAINNVNTLNRFVSPKSAHPTDHQTSTIK
jgi:uncharacterized protein YecE (DUF72 family)